MPENGHSALRSLMVLTRLDVAIGYLTGDTFAERLERAITRSEKARFQRLIEAPARRRRINQRFLLGAAAAQQASFLCDPPGCSPTAANQLAR